MNSIVTIDGSNMKGALIFLVVFAIVLIISLAYTSLPPGNAIYQVVLPNTEQYTSTYSIAGTNAFALIIAVFNGVIYAFIAWLIFTFATWGNRKNKNRQNVVVNVNNQPNQPTSPPPPQ